MPTPTPTPIPRTDADRLHELALSLFEPLGVSELLARAPGAIADTLGGGIVCRVAVPDPRGRLRARAIPELACQACLPLRGPDQLLGVLLIGHRTRPDFLDQTVECLAVRAAELLSAALDLRRRAADQEERARSSTAQMRSDVVTVLSHEMRTPLAAIKGYATALLMEETDWNDETRLEFLRAIDDESDRLTQLITDILDSAAIEAGALRIEREPVLLPPLVRRVIDKLAIRTAKHRFVLSLPPDFPIVEADAHRIDQVLTNLIDNAIKYSPDGGLIVVGGQVGPREVIVTVADQGIGIAPEHLNKLFERFFRARAEGWPSVAGTGLGLPISDAIIRAHGGKIWAESTLGRGTVFAFTLPRAEVATTESEPQR